MSPAVALRGAIVASTAMRTDRPTLIASSRPLAIALRTVLVAIPNLRAYCAGDTSRLCSSRPRATASSRRSVSSSRSAAMTSRTSARRSIEITTHRRSRHAALQVQGRHRDRRLSSALRGFAYAFRSDERHVAWCGERSSDDRAFASTMRAQQGAAGAVAPHEARAGSDRDRVARQRERSPRRASAPATKAQWRGSQHEDRDAFGCTTHGRVARGAVARRARPAWMRCTEVSRRRRSTPRQLRSHRPRARGHLDRFASVSLRSCDRAAIAAFPGNEHR